MTSHFVCKGLAEGRGLSTSRFLVERLAEGPAAVAGPGHGGEEVGRAAAWTYTVALRPTPLWLIQYYRIFISISVQNDTTDRVYGRHGKVDVGAPGDRCGRWSRSSSSPSCCLRAKTNPVTRLEGLALCSESDSGA